MDNVNVGYNAKTNAVTIDFQKTKEVSEKQKSFLHLMHNLLL